MEKDKETLKTGLIENVPKSNNSSHCCSTYSTAVGGAASRQTY